MSSIRFSRVCRKFLRELNLKSFAQAELNHCHHRGGLLERNRAQSKPTPEDDAAEQAIREARARR